MGDYKVCEVYREISTSLALYQAVHLREQRKKLSLKKMLFLIGVIL